MLPVICSFIDIRTCCPELLISISTWHEEFSIVVVKAPLHGMVLMNIDVTVIFFPCSMQPSLQFIFTVCMFRVYPRLKKEDVTVILSFPCSMQALHCKFIFSDCLISHIFINVSNVSLFILLVLQRRPNFASDLSLTFC